MGKVTEGTIIRNHEHWIGHGLDMIGMLQWQEVRFGVLGWSVTGSVAAGKV